MRLSLIFLLAACLVYAGWRQWRKRGRPGLPLWGRVAMGSALLGVVLWNLMIYFELGHFPGTTTGTGDVLYGAHCPEAYRDARAMGQWTNPDRLPGVAEGIPDEWARNRTLMRRARQSILSHSLQENARLFVNKLFCALYPSPGVSASAPLWLKAPAVLIAWGIVFGFLASLCRCPRAIASAHVPFYAATAVVVLLFYGSKRLIFPVFPLICIDSVRGWQTVWRSIPRFVRSSRPRVAGDSF